jgi:osmotically-inducible protein OsmY
MNRFLKVILIYLWIVCCDIAYAQSVSDNEINQTLFEQFENHPSIKSGRITSFTSEGIVTLTGALRSIYEKEKAVEIAQSILGVRAVVDLMDIVTPEIPDEVLEKNIHSTLKNNAITSNYPIKAKAKRGNITLSGKVENHQAKQHIEKLVTNVIGTKSITNNLKVEKVVNIPEKEIISEIRDRLYMNSLIDDSRINITASKGTVFLSGAVNSAIEKTTANELAWVTGVSEVESDQLFVDPWNKNTESRNGKFSKKSDEQISIAIRDALKYDIRLQQKIPEYIVQNGVVTIYGQIPNAASKKAAEQTIRNVVGVMDVHNHAEIQLPVATNDSQLAENVRNAINNDPLTDKQKIAVNVNNAVATLTGTVNTRQEALRAEDVAASLSGIADVVNNIEVIGQISQEERAEMDELTRQKIINAYRWSPFVEPNNIIVRVENGVAFLEGTVDNNNEFLTSEHLAYDAGAIEVFNNIEIVTSDEMLLNRRDK